MTVKAAPCRVLGRIEETNHRFFVTYDACVPGLPRRLDFFAEVPIETIEPPAAD